MSNNFVMKLLKKISPPTIYVISLVGLLIGHTSFAAEKNIYRSEKHSYSLVYPKGWEKISGRMKNTDFVAVSPIGANITIVIRENPEKSIKSFRDVSDVELKLLIDGTITSFRNKYKNVVVNDRGFTQLSNEPSIWMDVTYTDSAAFDATFRFRTLTVQSLYNYKFYALTCLNEEQLFKRTEKECKDSINSFIFEDMMIIPK